MNKKGIVATILGFAFFVVCLTINPQPVHAADDFHLQLRLLADLSCPANVRGGSLKRPPHPHDVAVGKAAVIFADVTCVDLLQGFL